MRMEKQTGCPCSGKCGRRSGSGEAEDPEEARLLTLVLSFAILSRLRVVLSAHDAPQRRCSFQVRFRARRLPFLMFFTTNPEVSPRAHAPCGLLFALRSIANEDKLMSSFSRETGLQGCGVAMGFPAYG